MQDEELAALLPALISTAWGRLPARVEPLGGGMNSATARVVLGSATYVAKWVSDAFVAGSAAGLAEAVLLAERGLATGAPLPTSQGALGVPVAGGSLALLAWVAGAELTGDSDEEQALIGATLARAHTLGDPAVQPPARFFDWFDEASAFLDVEPGLRGAVTGVLTEYDALPALTWAILHNDPAPEAFRHDRVTGETGLIDWTGACRGPLLYDVASAVMYLGGRSSAGPFLAAYLDQAPLPRGELAHLATLFRYRGAVQAAYFADRIARDDLTGTDEEGNREGLVHGLAMMRGR